MTKPKAKPPIAATPPQEFNELLTWHMTNGTRPDASSTPAESWRSDLLANATRCHAASIRNWRRGRSMPGERHVHGLAKAFFCGNCQFSKRTSVKCQSGLQRVVCAARRAGGADFPFRSPKFLQPTLTKWRPLPSALTRIEANYDRENRDISMVVAEAHFEN
jgi:hypothetical protein